MALSYWKPDAHRCHWTELTIVPAIVLTGALKQTSKVRAALSKQCQMLEWLISSFLSTPFHVTHFCFSTPHYGWFFRLLILYQWIELTSSSLWTTLVSKHAPHLSFLVVKSPADLFSWGCFVFWLILRTVVFQGSSLSGGIPGADLSFCLCSALWDFTGSKPHLSY